MFDSTACRGFAWITCLTLAGLITAAGNSDLSAAQPASEARQPRPHPWGAGHAPAEPPTATLSAEEADAVLVRDWLFQADNRPTLARSRQEIDWARQLAPRFEPPPAGPDLSQQLRQLDALEQRCDALSADIEAPQPFVPGAPFAQWSFDGPGALAAELDCRDGSGRLVGPAVRAAGITGGGLRLEGRGYVDAGIAAAELAADRYTISAWVKTSAAAADLVGNGTRPGCVLLMVYQNVLRGHHWSAAGANVLDGRTPISDGRWHHVAQVVDPQYIRLYVDGRLDAEKRFEGEQRSAAKPLLLGRRTRDDSGSPLAGTLDEVCIFDRALAAEEIARIYGAGQRVDPRVEAIYLAVRRVKRRIALANPVIDFDSLLFIDQPYPAGSEWAHEARHRNGMMAVAGGRLLVLDRLHPGGRVRKLAPTDEQGPAAFWRPDLSFDAKRVLFCMKPAGGKSFHLYEAALDGSWHKQLTSSNYDDLDPIYLPDGKILFCTTRANTYVRCMPYTYSYVLARCDRDGRNVYVLSQGNEPDYTPALLNDGRVLYTRWEYTDKPLWRIQSLWTVNPDGTNGFVFWGNQSVWPDMLIEARPVPGSQRVMFTGSAHHDWFAGSIGMLDPARGFDFPHGLTKVTADVPWPECGPAPTDPVESADYHASGALTAYKSPWPLSETDFLVSARSGPPSRGRGTAEAFKLYLMDVFGNRELIYEGAHNVLHAIPVRGRSFPVLPDRVAWPGTEPDASRAKPGTLYCADVYQGAPAELRGKAKYLRVIQMDSHTYSSWRRDQMPHQHAGPTVSLVQADGVKRILGTVPIHDDGSVQLEVPAGMALHFQLLDQDHRALQTMRSFTGVMPGERRSCVGCHETHSTAPVNAYGEALKRDVDTLTPPPWGADTTIGYERMIQPILERHCGDCHSGQHPAPGDFDVTLRPGLGVFKEPYVTLVGGSRYHGPRTETPDDTLAGVLPVETYPTAGSPTSVQTLPPLRYLSYGSRLINQYAAGGRHHKVDMPDDELRLLMAWVDLGCPYRGEEEIRAIADPDFPGVDDLPVRPRVRTAPKIDRFRIPQDHLHQANEPPE